MTIVNGAATSMMKGPLRKELTESVESGTGRPELRIILPTVKPVSDLVERPAK